MLTSEFYDRTGIKSVPDELWMNDERTGIHDVYMASGMDKDTFCKWWKKNCLYDYVETLTQRLNAEKYTATILGNERDSLLARLEQEKKRADGNFESCRHLVNAIGRIKQICDGEEL